MCTYFNLKNSEENTFNDDKITLLQEIIKKIHTMEMVYIQYKIYTIQ